MTESVSLNVAGLKCGGCENNVKTKLSEVAGILEVNASSKENRVDVIFEPDNVNLDAITQAITDAGYVVE